MMKSKLAPIPPKKGAAKKSSGPGAMAITRVSVSKGPQERTIDVRKIENGYIVRESECGPKGYKSSERFSPTAPKIEVAGMPKAKG